MKYEIRISIQYLPEIWRHPDCFRYRLLVHLVVGDALINDEMYRKPMMKEISASSNLRKILNLNSIILKRTRLASRKKDRSIYLVRGSFAAAKLWWMPRSWQKAAMTRDENSRSEWKNLTHTPHILHPSTREAMHLTTKECSPEPRKKSTT